MSFTDNRPTLETAHTKIWAMKNEGAPFVVGSWLIYAPWAHLAWKYHAISLIHLREKKGDRPVVLTEVGATHELMIFALDPKHHPDPHALRYLTPVSIVQQFIADNDAAALGVIERCLRKIADGVLSPDSDARAAWRHMLINGCSDL